MKAMVLGLGLAAVLAAIVGLSLALSPSGASVQAQGASPAVPANVRAADGAEPGQAVVRWDAVADAAYYRIGWVNMETFRAVQAEGGREWLDVFAFHDVVNRGQTDQTLSDLAPGVQYAFIAASVGHRFGNAAGWSDWTYLTTTTAEATSCPADAGTEPGAPGDGGTPTPTPQPGATPAATATATPTPTPAPAAGAAASGDYDADNDGLIEITSLAQLYVIRYDLDGDGVSVHADYAAAFPNAMDEMGCFAGCSGYELAANLDFDTNGSGAADAGDAYWRDGAGWLPIGDRERQFRYNAIFDGNGHTIANLFIRWLEVGPVGLLWATGEDADIRNVRLVEASVSSNKDWAGGLVGGNSGRITGSSVAGRVSGRSGVGGLAGHNDGSIDDSSAASAVYGNDDEVGGLVGSNSGSITDSYATGNVTGDAGDVGGLVGVHGNGSGSSISRSYSTGNVSGEENGVGGLVGRCDGPITASYATGSVAGESGYAGGLVGDCDGQITASYATGSVAGNGFFVGGLAGHSGGRITASYATGNVAGESGYVGGLAGHCSGPITASYATGSVAGERIVGGLTGSCRGPITTSYATGSVTGESSVGGLVGGDYYGNRSTDSYWNTQTTGQYRSVGGAGKTTRELQAPTSNTGIYAKWNADWWDFGTSGQYPVLKYQGMDVVAQRR